jgi:para-aminobenzoate synthetase/4-amino-4-deoxychorismate lyase
VSIKNAEQEFGIEAVFQSFRDASANWQGVFRNPLRVCQAYSIEEVITAIRLVEQETNAGRWAVVLLAFEAAPAFDPALQAHNPDDFPLAWVAIFDHPSEPPKHLLQADGNIPSWTPLITKEQYGQAIQSIHHHIESGDTYQVNYTFPMRASFAGAAYSWFQSLGAMQEAKFCAYMNLGRFKILSLSPELFFERTDGRLITQPMKGTMPRGRWLDEDEEQRGKLASSSKNRAENLMIVDLLRNDLGKISQTGSVKVTKLFKVETYRTVLQMTSTIESAVRPDVGLFDTLRALFPSGSITGAPKIRTVEIIKGLEPFARHAYTGSIGIVKPGGNCIFNVAIRTIVLDTQTQEATFHVGGGITYDSTAEDEYEECLLKAKFLNQRWPEFDLFETMLLQDGKIFLLERHVQRLKSSANYFGYPCDAGKVVSELEEMVTRHQTGRWKIRLFLKRDGSLRTNAEAIYGNADNVLRVTFATHPVDRNDIFLFHKTTNRTVYEKALREAQGCDEVILWNESGEITESAFGNIVIVESGKNWTPSRACGLLNGTFKEELMAGGELRERVITKDELLRCDSFYLINSVRKWQRAFLSQ